MIRLSRRGKIQYQFLSLIVLLLMLYSACFLLDALFQLPANPLALHFGEETIKRVSARCLSLLTLTGLVGAGLTMATDSYSERMLQFFQRAWIALIIATMIASPFLRVGLLDTLSAIGLLALLALTFSANDVSAFLRVWQAGMLLVCASFLAMPFAGAPWDKILDLFQWHVAYSIAALGAAFWLMTRFSSVERDWAKDGVKIVAVLLFLSGSLISIAPLGLPPLVSVSATPVVALSYMILASHACRALGLRNNDMSLAPHWTAVATLFFLVAGGFLGAISLYANVNHAMRDTALAEAQHWLTSWAILAILCACLNSVATELRGGNRRVTGYAPLWLVAFGVALSTIVQGCRGVVEIYLRDGFSLERARIIEMTAPLTQIWIICLLAVAIGIMTLALGFWARRPKIQVDSG